MFTHKLFKILFCFVLLVSGFVTGSFIKKEEIITPVPVTKVEEPKILECEYERCPVYESMDVDGDGDTESVVQMQTAMTQGFGKIMIIDKGKIVFDSGEKMRIGINQTKDQRANQIGFTLWYGTKINSNEGVGIEYTYKDGQFIPVPTP